MKYRRSLASMILPRCWGLGTAMRLIHRFALRTCDTVKALFPKGRKYSSHLVDVARPCPMLVSWISMTLDRSDPK